MEDPLHPRADELGLLGACLLGGLDTAIEVAAEVPLDAFFSDDIRQTMGVVYRLAASGSSIGTVEVAKGWATDNPGSKPPTAVWLESQDACPSSANAPSFAFGVMDGWRRRKVVEAGTLLASRAKEGHLPVDELISEAESVISGQQIETVQVMDGKKAGKALIDACQDRFKRQGTVGGIQTGIPMLDEMSDGLQPGEQAIVAARPSIGKTAFALSVLEYACLQKGVPTLFVSLEMSESALMRRLASTHCQIPMTVMRKGSFSDRHLAQIAGMSQLVAKSPLFIANGVSGMNIAALSACVRRHARKHGVKLVIVDYLQKVKPTQSKEKRTYEVAEVSEKLKALADKTRVSLLTLAQLNRESEKDKRTPKLSDLADSSQIERDGDLIGLLHRERSGEKAKDAMLIIAKQRDGETGAIPLHFDGTHCRFTQRSVFGDEE